MDTNHIGNPSAQRCCSLCGTYYTDDKGHDYGRCVEILEQRVAIMERHLPDVKAALVRAQDLKEKQARGEI